jgi:hypothetical protein
MLTSLVRETLPHPMEAFIVVERANNKRKSNKLRRMLVGNLFRDLSLSDRSERSKP